MNKKLFLLPIMAIVLILGGCSNSNRIDTSSLVQTITAENKSGKVVYNFYLLENSEDVQGVSVEADSLEKAVISKLRAAHCARQRDKRGYHQDVSLIAHYL